MSLRAPSCFVLCAALLVAQEGSCTVAVVAASGGARIVAVKADVAPAFDVLGRAAAEFGVELRADALALDRLSKRAVTFDRARVSLEELGLLVGELVGVDVGAEGDALRATGIPDGEAGRAHRARAAVRHVELTASAYPAQDRAAELAAARGRLLFGVGDFAGAYAAFQGVGRTELAPETLQELRLWAAEAALAAGRVQDALAAVEALERAPVEIPSYPGAELLPARVRMAAGERDAARVRLRRAHREARYPRDRALAAFLLAQTAWEDGDGLAMMSALETFGESARREFPDLAARTPFVTGLALSLLGKVDAALVHLRLAIREDANPERRALAARFLSEELRRAGRVFEALLSARQARTVAPAGLPAIKAAMLETELLLALGLSDDALRLALDTLPQLTGPGPESDRLLDLAATAAIDAGRSDVAEDAVLALSRRRGLGPRAVRLEAELHRRAGRPRDALRTLERLSADEAAAAGLSRGDLARLVAELALAAGDPVAAAKALEAAADAAPEKQP